MFNTVPEYKQQNTIFSHVNAALISFCIVYYRVK